MKNNTTKIIKKDQVRLSEFERMLLSGGFLPQDFNVETLEMGMEYLHTQLRNNMHISKEARIMLGMHYLELGTYLHERRQK